MGRVRFLLLIAILLGFGMQAANAASVPFTAILSGAQEVPPVATSANGTASGFLSGDFGSNNFVFQYAIAYAGLSTPIAPIGETGGHLHNAPAGANGPIVHILDTTPFDYTGTEEGFIIGTWSFDDAVNPLTEALAQALLNGDIYINLHTEEFNAGELRGQLSAIPLPGAMVMMLLALAALTGLGWLRGRRKPA